MQVQLRRDPEATRKAVGIVLYCLGMLVGGTLLLAVLFFPALLSKHSDVELTAMAYGAMFALPMLGVYLWVPWLVDRYDPEPLWALLMALAWGFVAACGFAALINTVVDAVVTDAAGKDAGEFVSACMCAPLVEEFFKGLAVFFMYYFMRREFDGVVDGVIYATFAALGFAACENILYYGNAAKTEMLSANADGVFASTFIVRGILAPWGHPLYTSMTGLGFGIARETNKTWLKWLAPLGGYFFAAFLHSTWNTAATISNALLMLMLPLWLLFVLAFFFLMIWLVKRKGRIIYDHLKDEVLIGNMTMWELALVASPVARIRATFSYGGGVGRRFVAAAARLALSKWHTGRATQGRKMTVSADMIAPLRQELWKIRAEVARALGRAVQQPQPWQPGQPSPFGPRPGQAPRPQYAAPPRYPPQNRWG